MMTIAGEFSSFSGNVPLVATYIPKDCQKVNLWCISEQVCLRHNQISTIFHHKLSDGLQSCPARD